MAAIAYPQSVPGHERPVLRLVPPPARHRRRPGRAVYRRRRLAVLAVLAVVIGLVVGATRLGGGPLTASGPAPAPTAASDTTGGTYVVQPGDTIWALARRMQPSGDVRELVDRLAAARQGAPLRAGERIVLPD
jgi:hypothetical protein